MKTTAIILVIICAILGLILIFPNDKPKGIPAQQTSLPQQAQPLIQLENKPLQETKIPEITLTTVSVENVVVNDVALPDTEDAPPSTDDNLIESAISDVVISHTIMGGRVASGRTASLSSFASRSTDSERYLPFVENGVKNPLISPLSTFSVDVDTVSYSNIRRFLNNQAIPPIDAVRIEEMINYFPYKREKVSAKEVFDINFEMAPCPWEKGEMLLKTTISTEEITLNELPPKNLVFLIDVSGSMDQPEKLPLLKQALTLLTMKLDKKDLVSIVVYAGNSGILLNPTKGNNHNTIIKAINSLGADGSTNGSGGITQAYEVATKNFIRNGINRIILCTDGQSSLKTQI